MATAWGARAASDEEALRFGACESPVDPRRREGQDRDLRPAVASVRDGGRVIRSRPDELQRRLRAGLERLGDEIENREVGAGPGAGFTRRAQFGGNPRCGDHGAGGWLRVGPALRAEQPDEAGRPIEDLGLGDDEPGVTDEAFQADVAAVSADLDALRRLIEG